MDILYEMTNLRNYMDIKEHLAYIGLYTVIFVWPNYVQLVHNLCTRQTVWKETQNTVNETLEWAPC